MNHFSIFIHHNFFPFLKTSNLKFVQLLFLLIFFGCSSTKRFTSDINSEFSSLNTIRVLLDNNSSVLTISVDDEILISDESRKLAKVKSGNKLKFNNRLGRVNLSVGNMEFDSEKLYLTPAAENEIVKIDGKKYRGRIVVSIFDSEIKVVNQIGLEDYVKGVMTKEMPIGKGNENYDALKAFSICARTYAFNKINENKNFFDIYPDTRDQVYGGVEGETEYTNKIVDETKGQLLVYENEPAIIFYHSTCGGQTEDVGNVFNKKNISYLSGVEDGDEPYCKISPRYEWTENYSELTFIDRLYKAKLIDSKSYKLSSLKIKSLFSSGRVNELEIILNNFAGNEKTILISGNRIRSIIRSGDGKSILRSTFFNINFDDENNIVIIGKGNGHGVGLCQWGAIGQSKRGINYEEILNHYFPGTTIKNLYD